MGKITILFSLTFIIFIVSISTNGTLMNQQKKINELNKKKIEKKLKKFIRCNKKYDN